MVVTEFKETIEPEQTDEYREGRLAYREGKPNDGNPYGLSCPRVGECRGFNNQRFRWFVGWYDEKNKYLLGLAD